MKFSKEDIIQSLEYIRKNNLNVKLVEADREKGFSYSYLIFVPDQCNGILVMDCLNNYEEGMSPKMTENAEAVEEIYSLFGDDRVKFSGQVNASKKIQEDKDKTAERVADRMGRAINTLGVLGNSRMENSPIIIPLIPGYQDRDMHHNESELNNEVVGEIAPQVVAMIEDAKKRVSEMAGIEMDSRIIAYGHSKSATFANNVAALHPEMVKAIILGGREETTLPLDDITLEIVGDNAKSENEQFRMISGRITKRITQKEFEDILQEYNSTKREKQRKITLNEDGTYSLPLNYPIGTADIEEYVDLSQFSGGKEEYKKVLTQIPRMNFVGEREEEITGHFAYSDGETIDSQEIRAGEDILPYELRRHVTEIERAGMHNRVLEYVSATRALFGRSANERLRNYTQLCDVLHIPSQSKIYEGVGHVDIYHSQELKSDTNKYVEGIVGGKVITLGDRGRTTRISPIYQLMRRYLVSRDIDEYRSKEAELKKISPETMLERLEKYIKQNENINDGVNMDKLFDELTSEQINSIFFEKEEQQKSVVDSNDFMVNLQGKVVTNDIEYSQNVDNIVQNNEHTISRKEVKKEDI